MSEDLPQPIIQSQPVVLFTGTLGTSIPLTTYRNASIISQSGIVYDDPTSIAVSRLDYKDLRTGSLTTLVANITHLIWGSSITSANLTSASFPNMVVGALTWDTPALSSLSLPKLVGTPIFYGIGITSNSLVSLELPKLEFCDNVLTVTCHALQTVTCPELVFVGSINIVSNALITMSMPKLEQAHDGIIISGGSNFTNILFGNMKEVNGNVTINGSLPENAVDYILVMLSNLEIPIESRTISLLGDNATPSLVGLAAKAALELNGNTVNIN